jgi:hypothetical protein
MKKIILLTITAGIFIMNAAGQTSKCDNLLKLYQLSIEELYQTAHKEYWSEFEKEGIDFECYCKTLAISTVDFILNKMSEGGVKINSMEDYVKLFDEFEDVNSVMYTEYMAIVSSAIEKCKSDLYSITVDGPPKSSIPMLKIGNIYKITVSIGSSSKSYILDSGADMSFISKSYAIELEEMNLLNPDNYIEPLYVSLADGSMAYCERVILNKVKTGEFTLNNVIFGVIDSYDMNFLLGKNVLNAFHSWNINNSSSKLELIK